MEKNRRIDKIPRRQFLSWLVPIFGSSAILFSFKSIYSGSINSILSHLNGSELLKNSKSKRRHKIKEVWHNESLILNTKTNIVHYPSEKLFTYYNRISDKHLSVIKFDDWESQILSPKHFIKGKSGIIIETLALNKLTSPITDEKLNAAVTTLGTAFSTEYFQYNSNNWRLYDLLIQLIALNNSVKVEFKWSQFFETVKKMDFHLLKIPKRNNWIKSKDEFDKRVEYIRNNRTTYLKRLEDRKG